MKCPHCLVGLPVASKKMFLEEIVLPIAIRQGVKTGMSIN